MLKKNICFFVFAMLPAFAVNAHDGHIDHALAAFIHPFIGWDHLLAMILTGMLAGKINSKKAVLLPIAFIVSSLLFAVFASLGWMSALSVVSEPLILLSLVLFGFLVASEKVWPLTLMLFLTFVFAGAHGFAHGTEVNAENWMILLSLALATGILHAIGYAISDQVNRRFHWVLRMSGVMAVMFGMVFLSIRG